LKSNTMKLFSLVTVLLMVLAGLVILVPQGSDAKMTGTGIPEPEPMMFSPDKFAWSKTSGYFEGVRDATSASIAIDAVNAGDPNGTVKGYYVSNDYTGDYDPVDMVKRGEGVNCEIWVQDNMSYPWGDPRNEFTSQYSISDEQVDYIIAQFDDNIYPIETDFFSEAPILNGSNEMITSYFGDVDTFNTTDGHKTMIMISNIRDENYYDPTYSIYIAGYFSPTVAMLYDRNVINIDCRDWTNRTGDNPSRPFLYEGVVAHEYQHLLHDFVDPSEETWINEGCSDYSEFLCGYGKAMAGHISAFLQDPSNSLTVWNDQGDDNILADYGASALFMMYLNDQFGGSTIIQELFNNNKTGTDSVTDTLKTGGYPSWNFEMAFKSWRLANLIHANQPGDGLYNYRSIDLDDYSSLSTLNYGQGAGMVSRSDYFNGETTTSTVGAYGTDYIFASRGQMRIKERLNSKFMFSGDDKDTSKGWERVDGSWWSGANDESDLLLRGQIDLSQGGPDHTLSIYTWYDIEPDWDYGIVQVSTDGKTWTSLSLDGVTVTAEQAMAANPDIYPSIPDQLPGFSGSSSGWTWLNFDLSEFNGKMVWVQFRYMTDWGTTGEGWYINDVVVDGMYIDYYEFEPVYPDVSWIVTVVMYRWDQPVTTMDIKVSGYNDAMFRIWQLSTLKSACILISPRNGSVDYDFGIVGNQILV
jgi:immune inhibitor A